MNTDFFRFYSCKSTKIYLFVKNMMLQIFSVYVKVNMEFSVQEALQVYKILIVDDKKIERSGIAMLIRNFNLPFETAEAENGCEALEYIKNNKVDVLFTDIRMPFMDGLDLIGQAKEIKPEIKSIIFSAYSDFEYAKRAIENKCDHYMLKPIDVDEFLEVMYKVVMEFEHKRQNFSEENEIIKNIIRFDKNYKFLNSVSGADDTKIINEIFELIDNKALDNLSEAVESMFTEMQKRNVLSMLYVKQIIIEIIKRLYVYLKDEDKKNIMEFVQDTISCSTVEEVKNYTIKTLDEICEKINGEICDGENKNQIIHYVLSYIDDCYMSDVSLEQIAEKVSLSPGYFSRVFKKEMGQGFVKYLTTYRLEKAKEKLVGSNMKIVDICKSVGIPDLSYFCFVFRKQTGLSPDEYRKKYR